MVGPGKKQECNGEKPQGFSQIRRLQIAYINLVKQGLHVLDFKLFPGLNSV